MDTVRDPFVKATTADLSMSAQTALQSLGLLVPVAVGATQMFSLEYYLLVQADNITMDFKFGWIGRPAGTAAFLGAFDRHWGAQGPAFTPSNPVAESAAPAVGSPASGIFGVHLQAVAWGFTAAGNLDLGVAQNTSDAGNLKVLKGSFVEAVHLG